MSSSWKHGRAFVRAERVPRHYDQLVRPHGLAMQHHRYDQRDVLIKAASLSGMVALACDFDSVCRGAYQEFANRLLAYETLRWFDVFFGNRHAESTFYMDGPQIRFRQRSVTKCKNFHFHFRLSESETTVL